MENLDNIASFIFDDMDEEDIVVQDEQPQNNEILNSMASLIVEDVDSSEDFEGVITEEVKENEKNQYEEELLVSLGQYGRYWKIEASKDKSDIETSGTYIPTASMQGIKNQSSSANRSDNVLKFVETYINNTQSTDLRMFRLWIERKDEEFDKQDKHGIIRSVLYDLTKQRDALYSIQTGSEQLKAMVDRLITAFDSVAKGRNLIKERYNVLSVDSRADLLVKEVDKYFSQTTGYYNKDIVQSSDLFLVDGQATAEEIKKNFTIAKKVFISDSNDLYAECECGATVNAKEALKSVLRKGNMYIMARYIVCPTCGKKILIHRNITVAIERVLKASIATQYTTKGQITVVAIGKEELVNVYDTLTTWKTPQHILGSISTEQMAPDLREALANVDLEQFIKSFLDALEIQSLNQTSDCMQFNVMEYLNNCNGVSMRNQSIINFLYNLCAPVKAKSIAEINKSIAQRKFLAELKDEFKELSKNKTFEPYIQSEHYLGSKFLDTVEKGRVKQETFTKKELEAVVIEMRDALKTTSYEEYAECSKQQVDYAEVYFSGLGKYIDEIIMDKETHNAFVMNMFDAMIRHELEQPKVKVNMPEQVAIPKEIANKLLRMKDVYIDALTLFNTLNMRMEGSALVAARECKRLNRRFFSEYMPPVNISLPGQFGKYYLYLSIMKSMQELRRVYLGVTEAQPNPWEASFEKTLLLYAIMGTIGGHTRQAEKAEKIKQTLKQWNDDLRGD